MILMTKFSLKRPTTSYFRTFKASHGLTDGSFLPKLFEEACTSKIWAAKIDR